MSSTPRPFEMPTDASSHRQRWWGGLLTLALITFAFHGLALFDGKILDDFWHQKGLREHGWSFSELMRTLIIAPADFLQTWWQTKPVAWHYFRPFFILCMKTVFLVLGRGDPMALHAFSLGLHFVSVILVWRLCLRLTGDATWSLIGGLLFAIYPHSTVTVSWPSSQNVVLQTTLLLTAMFAYVRASGLDVSPFGVAAAGPMARGPLAVFFLFWLLAIITRENAILMPAIFLSLDLAFGGIRHAWSRKGLYVVMGAIGIAFMAWREAMHIPGLPDVYCRRPDGNWGEYLPWLVAKFVHYICSSIWIAPMSIGPTGRYNPWSEVPGDCWLMVGIVAAMSILYWRAARTARGWWIWPVWIVLSIVPVAAVVATPHSGYMCGVGWAICAAVACTTAARRESRFLSRLTGAFTIVLTLGAAFLTPVNRLQWTGISAAEKYLPSWVMVSPPSHDVRDVFFLNMPFVNIYCKPNLVDRLGPWFEDVNVHVLTWAPAPLAMDRPTVIEQVDDHSFTVGVQGQAYYSRLVGRFALEAFRGKETFQSGQEFDGKHFRVRILDANAEGVWKLLFTFPRPLADARYCFYAASAQCGAARFRFAAPGSSIKPIPDLAMPINDPIELETAIGEFRAGLRRAAAAVFATAALGDEVSSASAAEALRYVARPMAVALCSPIQFIFDKPDLSQDDVAAAWRWWSTTVDEQYVAEIWQRRRDFDDLLYLRYEVDWDRQIAGRFLHSDLYLSGPPFAGPRGW